MVHGYGEYGIKVFRLKPNLRIPRNPKRKRKKTQKLGLLYLASKLKYLALVLEEDFLGEVRRDCREDADKELII